MRSTGIDVVILAAGEPDFPTPDPICRAGIEAIEKGFTKYTQSSGILELREKIADKLMRENGVSVDPNQVVVSCGAKHSLYNAMMVLLEPGDEVIVFAPYWMTYVEQIRLAGAHPVVLRTEASNAFEPDMDSVRAAVTPKTRAIVINSPSNPSGAVYSRNTMKGIAQVALRHDLWIVSDEIYEKLIYSGEHVSPASLGKEVAERTVTVNGCSKAFAMTGWRIGYAAAPMPIAQAMSNFQDQVTSNPTSLSQKGAVQALSMPAESIEPMVCEYKARRDLMLSHVESVPGMSAETPAGAFYVFADVSNVLGRAVKSDGDLATYLLEEAHVATIPGYVFDGPGHIRLSYAASRQEIERGMKRIADAFKRLEK